MMLKESRTTFAVCLDRDARGKKRILHFILAVGALLIVLQHLVILVKVERGPPTVRGILDGCQHVYLDLGTNRGIQIRKLCEPRLFPSAPILRQFQLAFGDAPGSTSGNDANGTTAQGSGWCNTVCVVGFEPNPAHEPELISLQRHYNTDCGYNIQIFNRTGVSASGDDFWYEPSEDEYSWGGKIISEKDMKRNVSYNKVKTVKLSKFIFEHVVTRSLPNPQSASRVMIKMDIEGSESEVMSDLLLSGAVQHVDRVVVEWHDKRDPVGKGLDSMLKALGQRWGNSSKFAIVDDETYQTMNVTNDTC